MKNNLEATVISEAKARSEKLVTFVKDLGLTQGDWGFYPQVSELKVLTALAQEDCGISEEGREVLQAIALQCDDISRQRDFAKQVFATTGHLVTLKLNAR